MSDLQPADEIIAAIRQIHQWRCEYGRDHLPFAVMATPSDAFTPDACRRLEDHGVTHLLTQPWPFYHGDTQDVEKKKDGIRRYADEVIARMG